MLSTTNNNTTVYYIPDPSINGVGTWAIAALIVIIVCLMVYEWMRRRSNFKRLLYPRVELFPNHTPPIPDRFFGWIMVVFQTPESFFIKNVGLDAVMFLRFLKMAFFLFLTLLLITFPTLIPINYFSGVAPTEEQVQITDTTILQYGQLGLATFSIANVPRGSSLLWAHLVLAYSASGITAYFLYVTFRDYSELAARYITDESISNVCASPSTKSIKTPIKPGSAGLTIPPPWRRSEIDQMRTILCRNLPEDLQTDAKLKKWFENLGIGEVAKVYVDKSYDELEKLISRRERTLSKLEIAYLKWEQSLRVATLKKHQEIEINPNIGILKKTFRFLYYKYLELKASFGWASNVDDSSVLLSTNDNNQKLVSDEEAMKLRPRRKSKRFIAQDEPDEIKHYTKKLRTLTEKVMTERQNIQPPEENTTGWIKIFHKRESFAFVTFKSQRSAQIAAQVLLSTVAKGVKSLSVELAPAAHDVRWDDCAMPYVKKKIRSFLVDVLSFFICFFWTVPVGIIASSTSLKELSKIDQFAEFVIEVHKNEVLRFILETFLPPLLVNSLNAIIPLIYEYLLTFVGIESHSRIEMVTMNKYFFFLFFNVFFVFILTDMIWTTIAEFVENPGFIVSLIAKSIPQGSTFFINYITLNIMLFAVEFLRPYAAIYIFFLKRTIHLTPRKLHDLNVSASYLDYGILFPTHLVIFVVVISYSIIAPIILIPGTIYFAVGWIVYRNQLLYVYVKEYESYGRHWTLAFKQSIVAMMVFQVTLVGYFATSKATLQSLFSAALLPLTYVFHKHCMNVFEPRTRLVPLEKLSAKELQMQSSETLSSPSENKNISSSRRTRHRSNTVHLDPAEVILSHEDHHQERYQTVYQNPLFVKPLPRPWIPASLGPYVLREESPVKVEPAQERDMFAVEEQNEENVEIWGNQNFAERVDESVIEMNDVRLKVDTSQLYENPFGDQNQL